MVCLPNQIIRVVGSRASVVVAVQTEPLFDRNFSVSGVFAFIKFLDFIQPCY